MLRRIDRILLRVGHLGPAVRFYTETMGMKLLRQDARLASLQFADGDAELILHTDADLPAEAVYYLVGDVRSMFERRDELKLQFAQAPSPGVRGYRAAIKDPFGNVLLIVDRTGEGASVTIEDGKPPGALFAGVEERQPPKREALVRIYEETGRTADDLPYTPQFERLYLAYAALHGQDKPTRQEVWRHLLNLRKGGKLPRLGEAPTPAPQVSPESLDKLRELLGDAIGRRDRLPYTPLFDQIVQEFNRLLPRPLSPHLVWRLVASMAK